MTYEVHSNKQTGAIILSCALCILAIVSIATVYTARSITLNQRIGNNQNQASQARHLAKLGVSHGVSQLYLRPSIRLETSSGTLPTSGMFEVSTSPTHLTYSGMGLTVIEMQSQGLTLDKRAQAVWLEQALQFSLLRHLPAATLTVNGPVQILSQTNLIANSNGLGKGLPLSLWSSHPLQIVNPVFSSCELHEFDALNCFENGLSNQQSQGLDILPLSQQFPNDLLAQFGASALDLNDSANQIVTDCRGLNQQTNGLIVVKGNCNLAFGQIVGSDTSPVWLMIEAGDLLLHDNSGVHGLVWLTKEVRTRNIVSQGSANIFGAIISDKAVRLTGDKLNLVYRYDVLRTLQTHPSLLRIATVPGSRRDF